MDINIDSFKPKAINHILNKLWSDEYGLEFQEVIKSFALFLDSERKLDVLKDKLFLKQNDISIGQLNQYIQTAVEFTVIRYFADKFPVNFIYEKELIKGSKTNVECQFNINNLTFNIEVKASNYINDDLKNKDKFYLRANEMGDKENYDKWHSFLKNFLPNLESEKRYDNNLGSHLKHTQSKLPLENNNDIDFECHLNYYSQ